MSLRALLAEAPASAERETSLARAVRAGDLDARDELVQMSLRLVALRVRHLGVRAVDIDDALQSGTLGLIAAVDRFDPDRGVRLATYAWPWITAAIRSGLTTGAVDPGLQPSVGAARLPETVRGDLDSLVALLPLRLAEVMRLRFRLGESDDVLRSHADVASRLNLTVAQVRWAEAQAMEQLRLRLVRLGHRAPGRWAAGIDPL